jgi:hypothetical protein
VTPGGRKAYDGCLRYAQRGGHTPAEQQRREHSGWGRRDTALQERQRQPWQQTPEAAVQLALDGGR